MNEEYGLKFVVNGEDYDKIKKSLNEQIEDLQQKVEQLEKENKELKYDCSCNFHDAEELNKKLMEIIDERNELDTKLIQLENIRKEAIDLINKNSQYPTYYLTGIIVKDLLNILNKGDNNGK